MKKWLNEFHGIPFIHSQGLLNAYKMNVYQCCVIEFNCHEKPIIMIFQLFVKKTLHENILDTRPHLCTFILYLILCKPASRVLYNGKNHVIDDTHDIKSKPLYLLKMDFFASLIFSLI